MKFECVYVGNIERFKKKLSKYLDNTIKTSHLYGLPVIMSRLLPDDKAVLIDKTGKVVSIFTI